MKKLLIIIISQIIIFNVYANEHNQASLKKCVDGDTATFIINNEEAKVRFLAINTPETNEKFGKEASDYTCQKLTSAKKIELEYDSGSTKSDKYGRTLAWIYIDEKLLQNELIENGLAEVKYIYGKYKYTNLLYETQNIAKQKKLGIWSERNPQMYTVTFKTEDEEFTIKAEENKQIEEIIPEKEGYNFTGWYLNDKKFDFTTPINEDITLIAKFEKQYTPKDIIIILLFLIVLYIINPKKLKKIIKSK